MTDKRLNHTELDYRAGGTVVCSIPYRMDGILCWLLLVHTGGSPASHCVAEYFDGAAERCNGTYCRDYWEAADVFIRKLSGLHRRGAFSEDV